MSSDHSETNQERDAKEPAKDRHVAVVLERDGHEARYTLFRAHGLTAEGAFLAGSLFLELGEEVSLAVPVGESGEVRTLARVVGLDVGATPGMHVVFPELAERDRELIETHIGRGAKAP